MPTGSNFRAPTTILQEHPTSKQLMNVAHFEGEVIEPGLGNIGLHEEQVVVIALHPTAEIHRSILDPVRNNESQSLCVERLTFGEIGHIEHDVPEAGGLGAIMELAGLADTPAFARSVCPLVIGL